MNLGEAKLNSKVIIDKINLGIEDRCRLYNLGINIGDMVVIKGKYFGSVLLEIKGVLLGLSKFYVKEIMVEYE